MSPASLAPLPNKNHVPATLIQLQQVKVLRGWDYKLLHPLDHSCFAALCGWFVWLLRRLTCPEKLDLIFCSSYDNVHKDTDKCSPLFSALATVIFFLTFYFLFLVLCLNILLPLVVLVYFPPKCFDLLTTEHRSESRHSGCRHQNISPYLLWECLRMSISLRFLAILSLIHSPEPLLRS